MPLVNPAKSTKPSSGGNQILSYDLVGIKLYMETRCKLFSPSIPPTELIVSMTEFQGTNLWGLIFFHDFWENQSVSWINELCLPVHYDMITYRADS
jgi:hypothetical protein